MVDFNAQTELCGLMTSLGSDKACYHNYTRAYNAIFQNLRNTPCTFFELGIGTVNPKLASNMSGFQSARPGGSLRAWKQWLGRDASVFGADIDKDILFEEPGIQTRWVDQTDAAAIDAMWQSLPDMNAIVEDGLHKWSAQKLFLQQSWHKLLPGGIYVIEDIHPTDEAAIAASLPYLEESLGSRAHILKLPGKRVPSDNTIVLLRKQ